MNIGQKLGMIRRGSQVDLYLPGLEITDLPGIEVGQKIRAGETTIRMQTGG